MSSPSESGVIVSEQHTKLANLFLNHPIKISLFFFLALAVVFLIWALTWKIEAGDHTDVEKMGINRWRLSSTAFSDIPDASNGGTSLVKRDSNGRTTLRTLSAGTNMLISPTDDGTITFAASALAQGDSPIQLELVVGGPNPTCANISDALSRVRDSGGVSPQVIFIHPGVYEETLSLPSSLPRDLHIRGLARHGVEIVGDLSVELSSRRLSISDVEIKGSARLQGTWREGCQVALTSMTINSADQPALLMDVQGSDAVAVKELHLKDCDISATGQDVDCISLASSNVCTLALERSVVKGMIANDSNTKIMSRFCFFDKPVPTAKFSSYCGYFMNGSTSYPDVGALFEIGSSSFYPMTIGGKEGVYPGTEPFILTDGFADDEGTLSVPGDCNGVYLDESTKTTKSLDIKNPRMKGSRFFVLNKSSDMVTMSGLNDSILVNNEENYPIPGKTYVEFITYISGYNKNMIVCFTQTLL